MADPEKAIKELTEIYDEAYDRWVHRPYIEDKLVTLIRDYIPDVVALLREQDVVEQTKIVRCRNCRHYDTECCSDGCGWCYRRDFGTYDEWYCADGEVK